MSRATPVHATWPPLPNSWASVNFAGSIHHGTASLRHERTQIPQSVEPRERSNYVSQDSNYSYRASQRPQARRPRTQSASPANSSHYDGSSHLHYETAATPTFLHSRTNSDASIASSVGLEDFANVYPVSSDAQSVVSNDTCASSVLLPSPPSFKKRRSLLDLPQSLLECIVAEVLGLPRNVFLEPQQAQTRCERHRQSRAGLDWVDVRLVMMRPVFVTSKELRTLALKVFHEQSMFIIDLTHAQRASAGLVECAQELKRFWSTTTPKSVRDTLRRILKLQIRVPTPSSESAVERGAKYRVSMDKPADGNWRVKHMMAEQRNVLAVQHCLHAIIKLIVSSQGGHVSEVVSHQIFPLEHLDRRPKPPTEQHVLKRLQIIFVKRSPSSTVLRETSDLLGLWQGRNISRSVEYFLELEGRKRLWATQKRGRWQGREPNGAKLLRDLQALVVPPPTLPVLPSKPMRPVRPLRPAQQMLFPTVSPAGTPHSSYSLGRILSSRDTAAVQQPESRHGPITIQSPASVSDSHRRMLSRFENMNEFERTLFDHPRRPSLISETQQRPKDGSKSILGEEKKMNVQVVNVTPPSVEELRQIVEDIRRGLY